MNKPKLASGLGDTATTGKVLNQRTRWPLPGSVGIGLIEERLSSIGSLGHDR